MPKNCRALVLLAALAFPLVALPAALRGQELLTLDAALGMALDSNRTVRLAANEAAIARNNYTRGNAGFLPRLDLTATAGGNLNNTRQELSSGEIIHRSGASSSSMTTGLGLTWTVFDGFRMFRQYDALKLEQEYEEIEVSRTREIVSAQVIRAYYEVVVEQMSLKVLAATVATSEDRVNNVQLKYEVGENSKRELLQAKVDLNADRSTLLRQGVTLANAKIALNALLARDPATQFTVIDTIVIAKGLVYDELWREALASNRAIRQAQVARSLAEIDRKLVSSARYPRVGINLGYNLAQTDNQVGNVASNRNAGLAYGLTASMNLFDGFNTNREEENAEIRIQSSAIELAEAEQAAQSELLAAHTNYLNRIDVVALERDNVALARENLDLALERYKVGSIIPLELREAQNAYVEAESRFLSATYDAKLAETELLRLSGRLGR
jgi:outer membrane protein